MGITSCPNLLCDGPSQTLPTKTIKELRQTGRFYRHPDSGLISYPLVVDNPLGRIDKPVEIAIVGGGVAGVAAIYELSRLPNASQNISITLFESDPEHFTSPTLRTVVTNKKRAGRVFAGLSCDAYSDHAVYEIGAMRFPEIAGLTWHYASQVFADHKKVQVFPNPGKVPTEFVQGERVDRYMAGGVWLDKNSPIQKLVEVVNGGLFGNHEPKEDVSMFPIGGKDPAKVSDILKSEVKTEEDKKKLRDTYAEWKQFAKEYDGFTLESAVRKVIRKHVDELHSVPGLDSKDAKVNYYVELFGRFGFGTGGFKPIFNISLVEMTRLILWEYSSEYALPVEENVQFIYQLYYKATIEHGFKSVTVRRAHVSDVCHSKDPEGTDKLTTIVSYPLYSSESEEPELDRFHYAILAVTPKEAGSMVSRVGFKNKERPVLLGDYPNQCKETINARPALILSTKAEEDAANAQIFAAINQVHMITSSKVFASIKQSVYNCHAPCFNGDKIKAIVSDCGLASSYIVASTIKPKPLVLVIQGEENQQTNTAHDDDDDKYYSCLLSYTWEEDTKNLQNELLKYPKNVEDENLDKNRWMIENIINRTVRDVVNPAPEPTDDNPKGEPKYERWWFGELLSKAHKAGELTDALSYDWTTHHSSGAFKLDVTGDYYNSHLLFRYHTHALRARDLDNRFFLAGDSFSHLGGWIEGAFMSAVNAVCGLILAVNEGDLLKLSEQAQMVVTSLDPVVSTCPSCPSSLK